MFNLWGKILPVPTTFRNAQNNWNTVNPLKPTRQNQFRSSPGDKELSFFGWSRSWTWGVIQLLNKKEKMPGHLKLLFGFDQSRPQEALLRNADNLLYIHHSLVKYSARCWRPWGIWGTSQADPRWRTRISQAEERERGRCEWQREGLVEKPAKQKLCPWRGAWGAGIIPPQLGWDKR